MKAISAGTYSACALQVDGFVKCWGNNAAEWADLNNFAPFQQITVSGYEVCGVTNYGAIRCAGKGVFGKKMVYDESLKVLSK